jgi:mannosyl-oligosaccharide alpha-1,2-mannosidase
MEHLSCFLPGLLALGAHTLKLSTTEKERHMWAAEGLAHTCWISYKDMKSGLGADEMLMYPWPGSGPGSTEGYETGRWNEHLLIWESGGRPGGAPPGLTFLVTGENENVPDYILRKDEYLLRPEVR